MPSVLGPVLDPYTLAVASEEVSIYPSLLAAPGLWVGFALGFGGSVVAGGRFAVTGAATAAGLAKLVDLVRRFGAPPAPAGTVGQLQASAGPLSGCPGAGCAIAFAPYGPALAPPAAGTHLAYDCSPWRWARLPRFPVEPVIPTMLWGQGLVPGPGHGRARRRGPGRRPGPGTGRREPDALALQCCGPAPAAGAGLVPVLAAAAQQAFWDRQSPDVQGVGDWQHFQDYAAGWPVAIPAVDPVGQALDAAARSGGDRLPLLEAAQQQCNAAAAAAAAASP